MADLTITASSVLAGNTATIARGIAGATITAGQVVYLDPTTGKYGLADVNSATAAVRNAVGIALNSASANQPIAVCTKGPITIGATILTGVAYYASGTPGGIRPVADNVSGDYTLLLGIGASTTVLNLDIEYPGVPLA
ncbi:hypothetical protein EN868_03075 [Mesorhizobium sp. M2D.F.Ca.ET.225.01.1.1]|uniref:hypothetical protein n=1 Tax=unclassified Mesorhizobium TaxID=325217 RepID=UPI000FD5795B|nr:MULTISPECIES: hypothetical protein [unclassified Mesorhizobium]TGP65447.1 hypothetical protein EN869_003080 [Mesorhizobium sp. M2D.F.Ca.ET.226.01.1.1]TGP71926.1 hypothetical protein EN868_03075 [Mesorhizobium sp. M2D.F.Ca.ET.225.01.1.1]